MTEHRARSRWLRRTDACPAPAGPPPPPPLPFVLAGLLLAASSSLAQVPTPSPAPQALQQAVQQTTTQFLPLLAGPVPADYKLGPGDQLVLILTGDVELAYTLQVTREGFILVPQVGQLFVSNLTLDQLRDVLYARLGRVYSGVRRTPGATTRFDISVANVRANQAYVVGEVAQPGAYQISSLGTVLTALYAAGGATARARVEVPLGPLTHHAGGSSALPVSVPSFGLEDGDVVVVDALPDEPEAYFVAITGMIQDPGRYPWRPGMTLRDLVRLARGPRVGALLREVEIARLPADRSQGQLATTVREPLDSTYLFDRDSLGRYIGPPGLPAPASGTPEVQLQPFDNALILRQPDFELQRTVTIRGEVLYPGTYALKSKGERLAELIKRAGGLTPRAYADGIRFYRDVNAVGRINIDLPKALKDTTSRDNVILQPGDSVLIPEYIPTVLVAGAVNAPGNVLYKKGAGLSYYIDAAGGVTYTAVKGPTTRLEAPA